MTTNRWFLHKYSDEMPIWLGWFEDENGVCKAFLTHDGELVRIDSETGEVIQ